MTPPKRSTALALVLAAAVAPARSGAAPVVNPLTDASVYPVAVWAMPARTAAPFAELGVNIFVAGERNARGWCDTLAMSNTGGFVHWSSRRTPEERAEVVASPGFLGWMHGDEPDNPGVVDDIFRIYRRPPADLQAAYDDMRASTTPAPMYLNLGQGLANGINQSTPDSVYPAFCRTADIVCFDVYPTSTQENGLDRLHLVARGVERLRRFAGPHKPVWIWLECTAIRDGHYGIGNRAPLPHEVRAQVWMAIVHGADGIGWFPHQFNPYKGGPDAIPAPVQVEMGRTNHLLHRLAPLLRTGEEQRLEPRGLPGRVAASLYQLGDQALVVAVNLRNELTRAVVELPAGVPALEPLGGAGGCAAGDCPCRSQQNLAPAPVEAHASALTLSLRPYEVAILAAGVDAGALDYTYPEPAAPAPEPATPPLESLDDLPLQPHRGEAITWSRTPKSRLAVPVLPTTPRIDGDLADAAWAWAAPLAPFTNTAGTGGPAAAIAAFVGRRDGRLYLAFRAAEPHLDSLVTRYAALWRNDCVEVWLDPDNQRTSFAHLILTSDGRFEATRTVQDHWGEGVRDEDWVPQAAHRSGRSAGAWTAELALDLADFGDAAARPVWAFDAARERRPGGGENSVWTLGRFNGAAGFGEIALEPAGLVLAGGALHNGGDEPRRAAIEVRVSRKRDAARYLSWEDQWQDLARQSLVVEVPGATKDGPGQVDLLTGRLAQRVPASGRVRLALRGRGPLQVEEFIANTSADAAAQD